MDIIKMVLDKTEMCRFSYERKKPFGIRLSIRKETFEIVCSAKRPVRPNTECVINISEIREIRPGKCSKDFETTVEGKKCDGSKCFVILYGSEFRLKTLSIYVESDRRSTTNLLSGSDNNLIRNLIQGLELLRLQKISYQEKIDIWILKLFESMNLNGIVYLKQMANQYMQKLSLKISAEKLGDIYEKCSDTYSYGVKFSEFSTLTKGLLHNQQIFTDCFGKYSLNATQLSQDRFEDFLLHEQGESRVIQPELLKEYFQISQDGTSHLTLAKAVDFLFSKENQVWDTKYDKVYQDMTQSLSQYWIASSHNTPQISFRVVNKNVGSASTIHDLNIIQTYSSKNGTLLEKPKILSRYLTGNQYSSESSVEAYIRALRQGCRCIEMDCFDGVNGPVIYHGLTLTTKISFVDVLHAIREHAFVTSEYPVIISIENHCSVKQQRIMAKKFVEIFGSKLIVEPLPGYENRLPSPELLKHRIILKGRKLTSDEDVTIKSVEDLTTADASLDINLSDAKKTGKMYLLNQSSVWEPYFFAIIANKLHFSAIEEIKQNDVERPDCSTSATNDELHFKEKWFHGDVPGGTKEAERRVQAYNVEGCFLVRNSSNCPGEYSLCLLSQGRAYHLRISSTFDRDGHRVFYLDPSNKFESLYLMVTYYRTNCLDTLKFRIEKFTTPVPPPDKHESEPWFHKHLDRIGAEQILANIPVTGAFLVRYAGEGTRFAISFRIDKLIKHCRINEDGRLLMVATKKFESISDLVSYYNHHTFYKWVKLSPAVTPELRRASGQSQTMSGMITHPGYFSTVETQVRALRDCVADNPGLKISFKKGDIISNVEKLEGDFWRGDLGDQTQKLFPKDFVELIEVPDSPFGSVQKGSIDIGDVSIAPNPDKDKSYPYLINIALTSVAFKAALSSEQEAKEWESALKEVLKEMRMRVPPKVKKSVKKSKIASELSQLVVYAGSIPKPLPTEVRVAGRAFNRMASYSEGVGQKLAYTDPNFFVWFTQVQMARIFPKGQRVDSSNYNPSPFWNVGTQLIALNYQTPEKFMQLNRGRFRQNGNCGYILKPDFLLNADFNPNDLKQLSTFNIKPLKLKLSVIAGRHVFRAEKGIMSPFVEIEIIGAPFDCKKVTTRTSADNGLNPFWNTFQDKFVLEIKNSALALIRFSVLSEDMFGDSYFIGEVTYPVDCLLPGYRSVPLLNGYGEEVLSVLLIHLQIERGV